jgi:hypothetical protein
MHMGPQHFAGQVQVPNQQFAAPMNQEGSNII